MNPLEILLKLKANRTGPGRPHTPVNYTLPGHQIRIRRKRNRREGLYEGFCDACGLMIASFDGPCPRCGDGQIVFDRLMVETWRRGY